MPPGEGITSRELVEEARRVAHSYVAGGSRFGRAWRSLNPMVYTLMGAGAIGLAWLARDADLTAISAQTAAPRERRIHPTFTGRIFCLQTTAL